MADAIGKFQQLLRELFQFDCADLDFGIYRIMNYKRDVIEKFVTEKLPSVVDDKLKRGAVEQQDRANADLDKARQAVIDTLGSAALSAYGDLSVAYRDTPVGQAYMQAKATAEGSRSRAAVEVSIYNHLYAFFSRYYQDGDFISKRRYGRQQRYAIPYNGEEVYLHWANSDQYYIKTGKYFRDYDWKAPNGVIVHFRLKTADVEQNNVKGKDRFFIPQAKETEWDAGARAITIPFEYRLLTETEIKNYGKQKQQDKIIAEALDAITKRLSKASDALAALSSEQRRNSKDEPVSYLEHHLRQYTRRNTSDFFIHKNLDEFLSRELDFYLKSEVLNLDEMTAAGEGVAEGWFQQLQLIKSVGNQVIGFLAQMENFQKMLWEKRKFVTETHYCITLGNIDASFYDDITANESQWDEWQALFSIDGSERNSAFLQEHPTLVLDTKHFGRDFTDRLLASFDDIDEMTDGLLVHSENWQALNMLMEQYRGQVPCIYIDPPYNTGNSEIPYKNGYKHSSWLSLMEDRLAISKEFLGSNSVEIVAIDEVEQEVLGRLITKIFPEYSKTCVTIVHNPNGKQGANFSYTNDFAYFIYPNKKGMIGLENRIDSPDIRPLRDVSTGSHLRTDAANCFYPIYIKDENIVEFGSVCDDDFHPLSRNITRDDGVIEVYPIDDLGIERKWVFARDTVESIVDELTVKYKKKENQYDIIRTKVNFTYKTVWMGSQYSANSHGSVVLSDIVPNNKFDYPKSINTVRNTVDAALKNMTFGNVLDYFAGSGTTGHAVIDLNREDGGQRKFILVEMGEYFDTVLLPRIKKVTFTPKWKDGKPECAATLEEEKRSPRIVKYIHLESYEDALNSIAFDEDTVQLKLEDTLDEYLLKYMLKWETKESETLLNVEKLISPFCYELWTHVDGETRKRLVDLPETFNYLLGLKARTRQVYEDGDRRYLIYRGETREALGQEVAVIWRETDGWKQADFERDRQFVEEQGLAEGADVIYANGDSCIPNAKAIEPLFKARMFAGVDI